MHSSDVAIIGAGPVGLGLAIELGQRGVKVTLIEKHTEPQLIPKGQNLTQRSGEHFRAWGVSNAIRAATPIPAEYGNEGLVAYGSLFSGYHYNWFKRASVREFYAADNERLPQYKTEKALRDRAASLKNIHIKSGWKFEAFKEADNSVQSTIVETTGHTRMTLDTRYLVGCDGARSTVRECAGITQTQDTHDRRMALLVFNSPELHKLLDTQFPGKTIFNALRTEHKGYWQFLGRVDLEHNWFFHAPVPASANESSYDFKALLHQAVGKSFELNFDYIGFWDLRFAQADSYQANRVFIAGDAAHSHPPYGGYGVNTGFEDARNLGWKMADVITGHASPTLLSSYTAERHPVFASTRDDFIARMINSDAHFVATYNPEINKAKFETAWNKRASGGQAEVQGYVPHYRGSPIIGDTNTLSSKINGKIKPGAKGVHSHKAEAGTHLSPQRLSNGQDIYELLSTDYTLILIDCDNRSRKLLEAAAIASTIRVKTILSEATAETDRWQASIIVVRPDHFIAYASHELDIDGKFLFELISGSATSPRA